jgi:NitT/TauT family transport system substrate-binding protein
MTPLRATVFVLGVLLAFAGCQPASGTPSAPTGKPAVGAVATTAPPSTPAAGGAAAPAAAAPTTAPAAAAAPTAGPARKLTVALSATSAVVAPLWVAVDEGLFRKYGLEVEIANFDGGSRAVPALVSHEAPIGVLNAGSVVVARLQGTDVLWFAGLFDTYYFQIYSRPTIRAAADLRGKTVAASSARSASERAFIDILGDHGLELNRDFQITYVGSQGGRLAALQQGLVDATIIGPPYGLRAREAGFQELFDLVTSGIPFGHFVVAGSEGWMRQNPEATRGFLRGYLEGIALAKRDKELTKRAIGRYTQTEDPALLEESYVVGVPQIPEIPWVREDIVRGTIATSELPQARGVAPQQLYDNSLLQELETAGFFRQLYGR